VHQVSVDRSTDPPLIDIPADFNTAEALLRRNLEAGRADKLAYVDDLGQYTYGELVARVDRFANALRQRDVQQEQRLLLCVQDSIEFPVTFLGAIKAGVVPVAVNTLLTTDDYAYMLNDSRAVAAVISDALLPTLEPACARSRYLRHCISTNEARDSWQSMGSLISSAPPGADVAPTRRDEPAFWL
jgi:benzoate-CoA ligase